VARPGGRRRRRPARRPSITWPSPTVALATSGTAARRWARGGKPFHHIIDPTTGRSAATCWRTVSVAAPSCLAANVASTAAIILGEAAPRWLAGRPATPGWSLRTGRFWGSVGGPVTHWLPSAASWWRHDRRARDARLGVVSHAGQADWWPRPAHPHRGTGGHRGDPLAESCWSRVVTAGLHRNLSLLPCVFWAIHVLTASLDSWIGLGWLGVVVPLPFPLPPAVGGTRRRLGRLLVAVVATSLPAPPRRLPGMARPCTRWPADVAAGLRPCPGFGHRYLVDRGLAIAAVMPGRRGGRRRVAAAHPRSVEPRGSAGAEPVTVRQSTLRQPAEPAARPLDPLPPLEGPHDHHRTPRPAPPSAALAVDPSLLHAPADRSHSATSPGGALPATKRPSLTPSGLRRSCRGGAGFRRASRWRGPPGRQRRTQAGGDPGKRDRERAAQRKGPSAPRPQSPSRARRDPSRRGSSRCRSWRAGHRGRRSPGAHDRRRRVG